MLGREVLFPSLADVGYLAAAPLAAAALLSLPFAAQNATGRVRQVLDGLMIAASLLLASWVLVLNQVVAAGADNGVSQTISLAYPMFAARKAATGPVGEAADAEGEDRAERPAGSDQLGLLLPSVAVAGALVVSRVAQVQQGIFDSFASWTRSFIIVALVGRQVLSLLENSSLAGHLEARVVERTAELRASEQRFQTLVQHSSEVVILVDADARVEDVSESMTRVFGYSGATCWAGGSPSSWTTRPGSACVRAWPRSPNAPMGSWSWSWPCVTAPATGAPPS